MEITLRDASLEDSEAIADVFITCRKVFVKYAPLAHSDIEIRQWVAGTLVPSGGVSVAVKGSDIVGMIATSQKEQSSWIDHLYLQPDFVGQGIGTRLINLAKGSLREPIRLFTFQQNAGSRRGGVTSVL
jgi:GNAT superfamily N-acetyltransferase